MLLVSALLIGVVAGLRALTAPAAVSWAARLGWIGLQGTSLGWLGGTLAAAMFTLLALGEFVTDQLPSTPSRTVPMQFGARLVTGGFSGTAVGLAAGAPLAGLATGVGGAVLGTLGGRAARGAMARAFGSDRPAALIEDGVAIGLACLAMVMAQ